MASKDQSKSTGPSGFIELNGQMLLVDFGKVFLDGTPVGFLYEDGLLQASAGPLAKSHGMKPIDEVPGCRFRGIDTKGTALELPGPIPGPTGTLSYNNVPLNVVCGRIANSDHRLLGFYDDEGNMILRDERKPGEDIRLDEHSQLVSIFKGKSSHGLPWHHEFVRPLYRKDKPYSENEIIRYFQDYDALSGSQKKYVLDCLRLWSCSGLLQIVRKSEGNAALGNVKHGAAGVTGVRTGMATLDREEFEKEIVLFKKFGAVFTGPSPLRSHLEVRINLVVTHEFGHQLEFILSNAAQKRIVELYEKRLALANKLHPLPKGYEGASELVTPQQVEKRVFISGYSRASEHEYWAEAVAAFAVKESRQLLKQIDPELYDLLRTVVMEPESVIRPVFVDTILALQASLRIGGEITDDLLNA